MFKEAIKYLRDNPNNYWFKAKLYGWGWVPVKWQGWLVLFGYVALFVLGEFTFVSFIRDENLKLAHILVFFGYVVTLTTILFVICYKKGERPRWQWGPPKQ